MAYGTSTIACRRSVAPSPPPARAVVLGWGGGGRRPAESEVWNSSSSWTSIERVNASCSGTTGIRSAPPAGGASSSARPATQAAIAAGPAAIIAPPTRSCGAGRCPRSRSRRPSPHHPRDQVVAVDRLGDVHLKAGRQRLPPVLGTRVSGQRDGGDRAAMPRLLRADPADERVAVLPGQADVGEEDVRPPGIELGERLGGRLARPYLGTGLPQDRFEDLARVQLVVDYQDAEAAERGELLARGALPCFVRAPVLGCDPERDPHSESGTFPLASALGFDGPPVELDEVAGDREAEPQAAERPRDGSIGLPEALEEVGEELGPDALARVANRQLEMGIHALEHDVDAPALGCELDRVGKEIPHHLLQPVRIALDHVDPRIELRLDPDVLGARRRPHGLDRRLDRGGEPHRADVEVELPADHPRDLEEVVDEPGLRPRAAVDHLERAVGAGGSERAPAQLTDPGEDRGERGAELVGHGGEELVLQAAGLLGLPVHAHLLDPEP